MRRLLVLLLLFCSLFLQIGVDSATAIDLDSGTAAVVGHYIISASDFFSAYDSTYKFYRELYKDKFNSEMEKKLDIKKITLDSLIDNQITLMAAENMGIKITEKELQETITHDPAFMKNGRFDEQVYFNTLKLSRLTPEQYKKQRREGIIISKVKEQITRNIKLTPTELKKASNIKALEEALLSHKKEQSIKEFIKNYKTKNNLKITINQQ